jgi:hypothetical protein
MSDAPELDEIGRDGAAMLRIMLQLATLIALRAREHGNREAHARLKLTQERMKEARQQQLREARDAKAKDPRNKDVARSIGMSVREGVSLVKPPPVRVPYDSAERRSAMAKSMAERGISPELAQIRMLADISQGRAPGSGTTASARRGQELERGDSRGIERTVW